MSFQVTFYNGFSGETYPLSAVPVGANWKVSIDGAAPGQPVTYVSNGHESEPLGYTDASGRFDVTFSELFLSEVGTWNTAFFVGGVQVGSYQVVIFDPPGGPGCVPSNPSGCPGYVAPVATPAATSAASNAWTWPAAAAVTSAPAAAVSVPFLGIPVWAWGVGALAALWFFGKGQ